VAEEMHAFESPVQKVLHCYVEDTEKATRRGQHSSFFF